MVSETKITVWRCAIPLSYNELDTLLPPDKIGILERVEVDRSYFDKVPISVPSIYWNKEKDLLVIVGLSYDIVYGFSIGFRDGLYAPNFYSLKNKKDTKYEYQDKGDNNGL